MSSTQAQYDAFIEDRNKAALELGTQALTNNPNVTYGQVLSPQELQSAAIIFSPELNANARELFDQNTMNEIEASVDFENRVKPYNRAPIEYDMYERHPEYMRQVDYFNSGAYTVAACCSWSGFCVCTRSSAMPGAVSWSLRCASLTR